MLIKFTQRQSSAIYSILFAESEVKVRYRTSRVAYPFTGEPETIQQLKDHALNVKKDPINNSIGSYLSSLIHSKQLNSREFRYAFHEIYHAGDSNLEVKSKSYAIDFKSVHYAFFVDNQKEMTIVKTKKNNLQENVYVKRMPKTKARELWLNLTKGRKARTILYLYHAF